jgi:glutamate---cysteine ligase / carboxylate-amine ligase
MTRSRRNDGINPMSKLVFNSNDRPTLGVEIELGLVDAQTGELANSIQAVLDGLPHDRAGPLDAVPGQTVKPELMQSCVEIITGVCDTVGQAEADLRGKIAAVEAVTDELGLSLWWGATHPFSDWNDQQVTLNSRYQLLVNQLQEMARRLVTFGLHVHVGVDSGDKAVMICDRIMQHLPTFLALTCSSPYWQGRDTGLQSFRSKIMEGLPTAGLPTLMRNWSEYVWLVNHMIDTGFIHTIREIWWDVRPHHNFGTVELRVCDMPGSLADTMGIAAFAQCLVQALSDKIDEGAYQHDCHPMMVRQNKWRAGRFGMRAQLVDSYTYEVRSVRKVVEQLVDRLRPTAEKLDCRPYLDHVAQMAAGPTWADRQLELMTQTGDPAQVVRRLAAESRVSPRPAETGT